MKKIAFLLIIFTMFTSVLAVNWCNNYDSAIKKARSYECPLLVYFYDDNDPKCGLFQDIIDSGRLDIFDSEYVLVKIDVADPDNQEIIAKHKISQIPSFALQDFDPFRTYLVDPVNFEAVNIFKTIYADYTKISATLAERQNYDASYRTLKLMEDFPDNMGIEVKKVMKALEPKLKKKTGSKNNDENFAQAESYLKTAESNIKNNNHNKAYVYLKKVIELAPGTELAKKAQADIDKIINLVDKSVILNKTEKK